MPLIQRSDLPSFSRLCAEGTDTPLKNDANSHAESHIALLNIMPDKALKATERQFIRLLSECHNTLNIHFHPFTLQCIERSKASQQYIQQYYQSFDHLKKLPIDALILSGTTPPLGEMSEAPFWQPLTEIFTWALENKIPTLFTCLASHCAIQYFYGKKRSRLSKKCWGVFKHHVHHPHPLTRNLPDTITIPHSRMNVISAQQMRESNLQILIESENVGVHMAISKEHHHFLFFQGHPEYDATSLLKEYKREIDLFISGQRNQYPPLPSNYFSNSQKKILTSYQDRVMNSKGEKSQRDLLSDFPTELIGSINNTWHNTATIITQNWLDSIFIERKG